MRKRSPSGFTCASAASSSALSWQTKTPLPAASPSLFTTQGALATGSVRAVGTPAASMTSLANAFEPSIRAAIAFGPKTAMPPRRRWSATPATSGGSGPMTTSSHVERTREGKQAVCVLGANRVAVAQLGNAWVARSCVKLVELDALRELPGKRVLAAPRADDEHPHASSLRPSYEC